MTSIGTSPTPPPPAASHESTIRNVSNIIGQSGGQNVPVIGQSAGPSYQPNTYHPHAFNPYYNQAVSYNYNMQPNMHASPAPEGPFMSSFALTPAPTYQSEPSSIPTPVPVATPSEEPERKSPVKRGPGRPRKQPTSETVPNKVPDQNAPRAPAQKGRTRGSQNWSTQDIIALTHFVEEAIPLGMNVWKRIEGLYNNDYAIPNNRRERAWDHMREKWYRIVSDGPPTGTGEIPDALNEVFRVNHKMEDIGGLVDPEDHPEGGGGGNSDSDGVEDAPPAKKRFVTSRPGTDGGSVRSGAGGSTSRQTKHGSASLAEKLLSSISPDAEARQNDNRAIQRLYLQQIRALEETVRVRELQNDALRQEVANLQEKLQTTLRELNRAEHRADKVDMRLEVLELMGKRSGRSSHRRRAHHKRPLTFESSSSPGGSASSSHHSRSPSRSALKGKRRRMDSSPVVPKRSEKGKEKMVYQEDEGPATSLVMSQSGSGNARATTPSEWLGSSIE
ncbi:hypothetical protein EDB85DRAFT_1902616 [Lactarius pseudohatsudake]|nr:hypothetical protein EDB85DRAFT_1902616 [Lactarius pseudohatsudake]